MGFYVIISSIIFPLNKMNEKNSPNKLGTEKIGKLLWEFSVPAIITTTATSLYNIIDRIFIGQGVGPMAIAGLALTFPLMNLAAAFGSLVGIGAATMVSIRLGQKDIDGATNTLGNSVFLNIVIGIIYTVVMLIFLEPILFYFGASNETMPYAKDFMRIILAGNIFTHLYLGLNNIIRASGYPKKAMIVTLLTIAMNIILAPVFIFGLGWGIKGAALATVCAQFTGTLWAVVHFSNKKSYVRFMRGHFKPKLKIISDIFSIGMSNFIMFVSMSIVIVVMNMILEKYGGDFAIGAFGIVSAIQGLFAMIVLGFNQGMQPIAGYNFGAQQFDRVKTVFRKTVIAGIAVTSFGFLVSQIFPGMIASAFTSDDKMIKLTSTGLHLIFAVYPIVGFQMVTSNLFQSIGYARVSIILSLSRQVIFFLPALLILSNMFQLNGAWLATPVADILSTLLTFFILKDQMRKIGRN